MWNSLTLTLSIVFLPLVVAAQCVTLFESPLLTQLQSDVSDEWRYVRLGSSENGQLYISQKAHKKSLERDQSPGGGGGRLKMFGLGLARQLENDLFVEDFLSPEPERIFWANQTPVVKAVVSLAEALVEPSVVALSAQGNKLVIRSLKTEIWITRHMWKSVRLYLERAWGESFPGSFKRALNLVARRKHLTALPHWEMAVTPSEVLVARRFVEKVHREADRQGLEVKLTMHQHPRVRTPLEEPGPQERDDYYRMHLSPSKHDLLSQALLEADWFEIRTLGTPADLSTDQQITSRFYDMREIRKLQLAFAAAVDELLHFYKFGQRDLSITHLEMELNELALQVQALCLPLKPLAQSSLSAGTFEKLMELEERVKESNSPQTPKLYKTLLQWTR